MQFVFPAFLFALVAVAIPVVIHLFHFRRFRKVYFSDVSFLHQLSDESKKQSRLKHLLVLAARMLAISFLVLAFARPFIPSGENQPGAGGSQVAVYIDNSFSMDALARSGRLLDEAIEAARQVAATFQPADRFMLLTNEFEGRHQRFVSRDEFLTLLNEVSLSPTVKTIEEVLLRKNELFSPGDHQNQASYFLSDFQKSMAAIGQARPDSGINISFIPLQAQGSANLAIDSCWFVSPLRLKGQAVTLKVRIRNYGDQPLENQPLRLFINHVQRTVASFSIAARGQTEESLTWTILQDGFEQGKIEIADYPISFDDQFFFSYHVANAIPVLSIDEPGQGPYLQALFGRDTTFQFSSMPSFAVDFGALPGFSMVVLNGLNTINQGLATEALQYARQGGHLVIFPGAGADLVSYNNFFAAMGLDALLRLDTANMRVSYINADHPIYTDVFENIPENIDLPRTLQHYVVGRTARSPGQALMQLQNGNPFLMAYELESGKVFVAAVPLSDEFSNFQRHAVFVPTLVNIALHSGALLPLFYTVGANEPVIVKGASLQRDQVLMLRGTDTEVIPEQRQAGGNLQIFLHDQVKQAGNLSLVNNNEVVKGISLNYDRRESVNEVFSAAELKDMLLDHDLGQINVVETTESGVASALEQASQGLQLWKLFIVLALACILAEVLLLRFMP